MTHILQRQTGAAMPVAAGGDGIYVIDKAGKRYVDATGGPSVACLGHGDPDVRRAVKHVIAYGGIYEEILSAARKIKCDLIVIAAQRPELKDYLLGPNAARVVRHADCSVLVVRG